MMPPPFETIDVSISIKRDATSRRIPTMTITNSLEGSVSVLVELLYVRVDELAWEFDINRLPTGCVPEVLEALEWFSQQVKELAATPASTAAAPRDPNAPPKRKRPSRAKPKPPHPGERPVNDGTLSMHPDDYPDRVRQAAPPPPIPGGYPTDLGVWAERDASKDEYGPKGGLT